MTYTTRCNAAERAAFRARRDRATGGGFVKDKGVQHGEPALGTVEERLSIALARLGVPQRIVLTREERALRDLCEGEGAWTQEDLPWGWAS